MTAPPVDVDVLIVGSGPAGVSAAFPLVEAGLRVAMLDGGQRNQLLPPDGQFLDIRRLQPDQWDWMVGRDFHALRHVDAISPKLRVPTHAAVFEGFANANRIVSEDFVAVGSLAPGGLSNAWGCGVACLTDEELKTYPVTLAAMRESYAAVATRIGVSGGRDDDLSGYFGLDDWSQPAIAIDVLQGSILERYARHRQALHRQGFRLGRARVAALSEQRGDRLPCDRSDTCLWGCARQSLYSATHDLTQLRTHPGFFHQSGYIVARVFRDGDAAGVEAQGPDGGTIIRARRVLLAAGTLASTRLALAAIRHDAPVAMQSCPTAAFMLWLPRQLGQARTAAFGLGQLSFSLDLADHATGFGSLFSTTGIPVTEFARHMPFAKRYSIDFLEPFLTSCVVGNVFLPGAMSQVELRLDADDRLVVKGAYRDDVAPTMATAHRILRAGFRKLGAILMPGSFQLGKPGSDIHYAASLPMRASPLPGETDPFGELAGMPGVHVVDGASLSTLPAKSHTLTIMANADRIGTHLARQLGAGASQAFSSH